MNQEIVAHIGRELGRLLDVDYDQTAVFQAEYVRVRLNWDVNQPLRLQRNFQFTPGVNTLLRLRYERLRGFCEACGLLTHDSGACLVHDGGFDGPSDDDGSDDDQPPAFHHNQGVRIEEIHEDEAPANVNQMEAPVQNGGEVSRYEEMADDPDGYAEYELMRFPAIHNAVVAGLSDPDQFVDPEEEIEAILGTSDGLVPDLEQNNRKRKHEETEDDQYNRAATRVRGEGSGSNSNVSDDVGGAVGPEPPLPP